MRDLDVRIAVRKLLGAEHADDADTRIVEEMGIWNGAVRVDVAVINGELCGYEIKSARDTLSRLPAQALLYNAVFDRVHLVAAGKHREDAEKQIPAWWGIMVATAHADGVDLELARPATRNPDIEPIQIARLLWRDEALEILCRHGADQGVKSGAREKVFARLAESLPLDELRYEVRRCLKDRQAWLGQPVHDKGNVAIGREA